MKHNRMIAGILALILAFGSGGCSSGPDDFNASQKGATEATRQKNEEVYRQLDFNNKDEINAAAKGLLDSPESLEIKDEDGSVIWSQKAFSFVTEDTPSPDTVHPGLWSNAQMNRYYGLFQVHDRIFQVRGYDVTNLTLIAGDTGWIIIDPMSNAEAMRAALELIEKDIEERPIAAVIYTAASVNHYGGVGALLEDAAAAIPIIAPRGFLDAAGTENLFTENSSRRQSEYLYGSLLPASAQGSLFIGKDETTANGTATYLTPNDFIQETGETREIDGVEIQFQLSEDTTGNVAMNLYFPDTKCLWLSENCSGTLHDLYDVTGEKSSRPDQWADFLTETYALYGSQAEIVIEAHNWAPLGKGCDPLLPFQPGVGLSVCIRSDPSFDEPRLYGVGNRSVAGFTAKPCPKLVSASVLLLLRRQHPHSIPVLSNRLHPEPGGFKPADGNRDSPPAGRISGRCNHRFKACGGGFCQGRLPMGGPDHQYFDTSRP